MTIIRQLSFAAGEIAPALYGRTDQVKYATGLRTAYNGFVMRHGGFTNRPGTTWICEVKNSSDVNRLLPFVYNASQTYVLEMGEQYLRVIKDGVVQTDLTLTITGISNANPGVVTYTGTDPVNGEEVYISGIVGAIGTYLNNRNFKIANVNGGANTFELKYMDGTTNVNTTAMGAYGSAGTAKRIYTIATAYADTDLAAIQFIQSADVVTMVHPTYAPRELSRTADTSWAFSTISFAPDIARPAGCTSTIGVAGADVTRYKITAIAVETYEESLAGKSSTTNTISAITQANPAVVTYVGADNYSNGDTIFIDGIVGMTELNGREFVVANVNAGANTFQLLGEDSSGYAAWSSGGTIYQASISLQSSGDPTSANPNVITWTAQNDAAEYNVYKEINGVFGFIGIAGQNRFEDIGLNPDITETPPSARNPFDGTDNYPSAVAYYQQKLGFAATNNDPEKTWLSKTSLFHNLSISSPLQDDDAVTYTLQGRQVNKVQHLVDLGKLIQLTSGGEWVIAGDSNGVIKPADVNPRQTSYYGSAAIAPIIVGGTLLFVQARGNIVRDLTYDLNVDGYSGSDLTIFSAHLLETTSIVSWAYQQIPHSVVWIVRDDGTMVGMTYVREHELVGWHRHETDGFIENVTVVPEGDEDVVYITVKRTIDGSDKRYIERLNSRKIIDIKDAIFMDCTLSYDGRNTNTGHTMTLSGGTNWTYDETLTLSSSAGYFTASEVGNQIHLTGSDGTIIRFTIAGYTNTTTVTGTAHKTVPVAMRSVAISNWARAVDTLTGCWHIEGKDVSIFADGFVVASPNNAEHVLRTVENGTIVLDRCYSVIHVGLPYITDIETLNIDTVNGETLLDKQKLVNKVSITMETSRGIWVGGKAPTGTDPLENLTELKIRNEEDYDSPVSLTTDTITQNILPDWNSNGRVFIRQVDPLPMTILAIAPAGILNG